ncbi:hypothetical protein A8B75_11660 [Sphingomonadales bacterium EhC05]|nr:hypothetical protein A8B75_11660 [Sphingomonadales bacterium EhC05]
MPQMGKPPAKVPKVDLGGEDAPEDLPQPDQYEAIALRSLDADAKAKENVNREANQRYYLRWLAVIASLLIMSGMGWMLSHVVHKLMSLRTFGTPSAYIIAIYVAPILSMTGLSIALLVAAFRGFKDGDGDTGAKALSEGAKMGKLMQ